MKHRHYFYAVAISLIAAAFVHAAYNEKGGTGSEPATAVPDSQTSSPDTIKTIQEGGDTIQPVGSNAPFQASAPAPKSETEVIAFLHRTNLMEIEIGKLAQERGSTKAIRDYAQTLKNDHQKSEAQVKDVANKLGVALAKQEETLAANEHQQMTNLKSMKKGAAFDHAFVSSMVENHKQGISNLETAQTYVTAGPVYDLIIQTLPVLQQHQAMGESLLSGAQAKQPS